MFRRILPIISRRVLAKPFHVKIERSEVAAASDPVPEYLPCDNRKRSRPWVAGHLAVVQRGAVISDLRSAHVNARVPVESLVESGMVVARRPPKMMRADRSLRILHDGVDLRPATPGGETALGIAAFAPVLSDLRVPLFPAIQTLRRRLVVFLPPPPPRVLEATW